MSKDLTTLPLDYAFPGIISPVELFCTLSEINEP